MLSKLPDKPGHILFVVGEYPPMVGGVGAYTSALGLELVERGWQVSVLTHVDAQGMVQDKSALYTSTIKVYPMLSSWGLHMFSTVAWLAKEIGADLIHVQFQIDSFDAHPAMCFAPLWWRMCGLPVTLTFHDLNTPFLHRRLRRFRWLGRLSRFAPWVRDAAARLANGVISTNHAEFLHLKKLNRHGAEIPIGSNVNTRQFSSEERRLRRALRGFDDHHVVIGYFGFMNESKGVLDLLKAVETLSRQDDAVQLFLIGQSFRHPLGNWQGGYIKKLHDYIEEAGLADRITSTGYEIDAEISADLNACDVMVFLYQDGASTRRGTFLAALTQGCAIVATTPQGALPEIVNGRDVLFVPIGDADATIDAIRSIVYDPALKAELGQNALAASDNFAWRRIASAHERFFLGHEQ